MSNDPELDSQLIALQASAVVFYKELICAQKSINFLITLKEQRRKARQAGFKVDEILFGEREQLCAAVANLTGLCTKLFKNYCS
jgi:hypothetical protein